MLAVLVFSEEGGKDRTDTVSSQPVTFQNCRKLKVVSLWFKMSPQKAKKRESKTNCQEDSKALSVPSLCLPVLLSHGGTLAHLQGSAGQAAKISQRNKLAPPCDTGSCFLSRGAPSKMLPPLPTPIAKEQEFVAC